jgi:hypothetical protein
LGVDRSIPSLDLYRELGVDPTASTETIEAAYRSLMKRHHPDRAGPAGLARSKRLNLAREWLVDRERRTRYDAARQSLRVAPPGSLTRSPRPTGVHWPNRSWTVPLPTMKARPSSTGRRWHVRTTLRLRSVGIVSVVAVSLVVGLGWRASGDTPTSSTGTLGLAASGPSAAATPLPTTAPTATPNATSLATQTPAPTPRATVEPTARPTPVPAGGADIHFSGMYAEHDDQALGGASACTTATVPAGSAQVVTGFEIDSGARSRSRWQLTLADLAGSWSMDIFFGDTADALWWNSGIGVGSVTRLVDGFAFDVVMSDSSQSIRAKGTVTCH